MNRGEECGEEWSFHCDQFRLKKKHETIAGSIVKHGDSTTKKLGFCAKNIYFGTKIKLKHETEANHRDWMLREFASHQNQLVVKMVNTIEYMCYETYKSG